MIKLFKIIDELRAGLKMHEKDYSAEYLTGYTDALTDYEDNLKEEICKNITWGVKE